MLGISCSGYVQPALVLQPSEIYLSELIAHSVACARLRLSMLSFRIKNFVTILKPD